MSAAPPPRPAAAPSPERPGDAPRPLDAEFARSVLEGLSETPKRLECKYLYDAAGSALFDRITEAPEYYPTRTELAILDAHLGEIAREIGPGAAVIEPGSGAGVKTRRLLAALDAPAAFAPVEISAAYLRDGVAALRAAFPELAITPIQGDFTTQDAMPEALTGRPRLAFFPGSTIGNFAPEEASALLARFRRDWDADLLLIGFDLIKDAGRLTAAYDDAGGVTAAFNLNLLARINRELGAAFDLDAFAHEARWNAAEARIEMHLVSRRAQTVAVSGRPFAFAEGESIHTENSYKFDAAGFDAIAAPAGWRAARAWSDPEGLFRLALCRPA